MNRSFLLPLCVAAIIGGVPAVAIGSPTTYSLLTTIPVPADSANVQPGGEFTSFDISFFDPSTRLDYVADRSNASVDIFSAATLSFVGRATGFSGQAATTSLSGADGVLVVSSGATHTLFAGDGTSTLKIFNVSNPAAPILLNSISTGGSFRVDEMAYSPSANLVLVANNADSPAFGTLINATTGAIVRTNITIPGASPTDGLEQSVWNPATGTFFISVPSFGGGTDPGGVAEISTTGDVLRLYKFGTMGIASCSPTGLALGGSGNLMVGCGNAGTQTVLLNPAGTGSIVDTFTQISGSDEIWYDSTVGDFFVTGVSAGLRSFDVINDATDAILQSVALPNVNAHSISVDPLSGDVFVPLEGSTAAAPDSLCPSGCIAVFAQASVPEPETFALMAAGLLLMGWAGRRQSRRKR